HRVLPSFPTRRSSDLRTGDDRRGRPAGQHRLPARLPGRVRRGGVHRRDFLFTTVTTAVFLTLLASVAGMILACANSLAHDVFASDRKSTRLNSSHVKL